MKKLLSILLVMCMVATALTACAAPEKENSTPESKVSSGSESSEKSTGGKPTEPYDVSMLISEDPGNPYSEDWAIWPIIEENTGATLEVQSIPSADYETKKNLLINTGDVPDVMGKIYAKALEAASGQFVAVDTILDRLPNFTAHMDSLPGAWDDLNLMKGGDGHYYSIPMMMNPYKIQTKSWIVREDIFEKHDLEYPTDFDELYEVGLKLLELYPDSSPLSNVFGTQNIASAFAAGFDTLAGWSYDTGVMYRAESDSFVFAATMDHWKQMAACMNKLYEAGVLDKEFSTIDQTTYEQKIVQGDVFMLATWVTNISGYNKDGQVENPDYKFVPMNPPKGVDGFYGVRGVNYWTQMSSIGSHVMDREDVDSVMYFVDWFYTDEAELLTTFGTPDLYEENEWGYKVAIDDEAQEGLGNNSLCGRKDIDSTYGPLGADAPLLEEHFKWMADNDAVPDMLPASPLTPEKTEELQVTVTGLLDYTNTMLESFIFGKSSIEDDWDDFVAQCEAKGSQKLVDACNEAWQANK